MSLSPQNSWCDEPTGARESLTEPFLADDYHPTHGDGYTGASSFPISPIFANDGHFTSSMSLREQYKREMNAEKRPRFFTPDEREKMQRYEGVDTYEPVTTVYKDHLESRSKEPRWFIWVFVFVIGIASSAIAISVVCLLHVLNGVRYELLGFGLRGFSFNDAGRYSPPDNHTDWSEAAKTKDGLDVAAMFQGAGVGLYGIAPRSYVKGYLMWIVCSFVLSSLSSIMCAIVPESIGSGLPEVRAYLNGVRYPMLDSLSALFSKIVSIICSVASGVCTGYYGVLIFAGAMVAAQSLQRRHFVQCYSVNIIECFRNPRDRRVIVVIGAAAGVASAFSVSIGGLMVVVELISTTLPVRFALYVFAASLVSSLTLQVYFSYFSYFDLRNRSMLPRGELIPEIVQTLLSRVTFDEMVHMNIFYFIPAVVIGLICGGLSGLFTRISWLSLVLRRRLERRLRTKAVRYVLPVLFTLIYVTINYWVAVAFGSGGWEPEALSSLHGEANASVAMPRSAHAATFLDETNELAEKFSSSGLRGPCVAVPSTLLNTRNVSVVAFYGANGFFCAAPFAAPMYSNVLDDNSRSGVKYELGRHARPQTLKVLHSYASLAFANADSALQTLLSWRTADMLSVPVLVVFLLIYFISSAIFTGISLCGDVLLTGLVVGAAVGRLLGLAVHLLVTYMGVSTHSWVDPGCFALIGAGSFISGTTGLTFSICVILMESTGDFAHLLPLMLGITVAKKTAELTTHNIHAIFLEARSVPMLDFETQIRQYPHFDARHVMASPVVTLETLCPIGRILHVLRATPHNGFPIRSVRDGTYKGLILRRQLELLLWHAHFTLQPIPCAYEVAQKVERRLFRERRLGTAPPLDARAHERIDLSAHIDPSGFCVRDTTTLPRAYGIFRALGLRHLVVVSERNRIRGIVTRKDLSADKICEAVERESAQRRRHAQFSSLLSSSSSVFSAAEKETRRRGERADAELFYVMQRPGGMHNAHAEGEGETSAKQEEREREKEKEEETSGVSVLRRRRSLSAPLAGATVREFWGAEESVSKNTTADKK